MSPSGVHGGVGRDEIPTETDEGPSMPEGLIWGSPLHVQMLVFLAPRLHHRPPPRVGRAELAQDKLQVRVRHAMDAHIEGQTQIVAGVRAMRPISEGRHHKGMLREHGRPQLRQIGQSPERHRVRSPQLDAGFTRDPRSRRGGREHG